MHAYSKPVAGPRASDPHQLQRVKPATLAAYRKEAADFWRWLVFHHLAPESSDQWDDLAVEFKTDSSWHGQSGRGPITLSRFTTLLAAIEFHFARFRGKLGWAKAVAAGW